jgi:asparagine synthase (glutamine-hydrolysing)
LAAEGRRLTAVTAVLPEERSGETGDSRKWAEIVRAHVPNLDLHFVTLEDESVIAGPETEFRLLDRPLGGWQRRFGNLVRQAASLGVDVLFTGFGGDHAATSRGAGFYAEMLRSGRFITLARECRAAARKRGRPAWRFFLRHGAIPLLPEFIWRAYRRAGCGEPLAFAGGTCAPEYARRIGVVSRLEQAPMAAWRPLPSVRANSLYAIKYIMRGTSFLPIDQLASACGVRVSHPMLDKDLVEFALSLPARQHIRNGTQRHIIRHAGVGILPPETLSRPDGNDSAMPDFLERMKAAVPEILHDIEQLGQRDGVRERIDITKLRRLVDEYPKASSPIVGGELAGRAMRGFMAAHFVEWFERGNP